MLVVELDIFVQQRLCEAVEGLACEAGAPQRCETASVLIVGLTEGCIAEDLKDQLFRKLRHVEVMETMEMQEQIED